AIFAVQVLVEVKKDETNELIINLITNLLDLTIKCKINEFNKYEEDDVNNTDKELSEIPIIEKLNSLKKF
ncbi:14047_t:CDS:2, partial [Cetraspora pellucida]